MSDLSQMSDADLLKLHEQLSAAPPPRPLEHLSDEDLLKLHSQMNPKPDVSQTESALRGMGQGATLGYGDEGSGQMEALMGAGHSLLTGHNNFGDEGHLAGIAHIIDNYRRARDTQRQQNDEARSANPKTYMAGQVVGGAPLAIGTAGLGTAAEGAGLGARALQAAGAGAAYGGADSLGNSNADLTRGDVLGAAGDTAKGLAIGGTLGLGGELAASGIGALARTAPGQAIQRGVGKVADYFGGKANSAAVDALGGTARQMKKIQGNNQIDAVGQQLRDTGVMDNSWGIFPPSRDTMSSRAEENIKNIGGQIGDMVRSADTNLGGSTGIIPSEQLAQEARETILKPLMEQKLFPRAGNEIQRTIENFENTFKGQYISLEQMQAFKKEIANETKIFNKAGDTSTEEAYKDLYDLFNKKVEDTLDAVGDKIPGVNGDQFKQLKKSYGANVQASDMLDGKLAREAANNKVSLTDMIAGGAGLAAGAVHSSPAAIGSAVGLAALNHGAKKFGNQAASGAYGIVQDILKSAPQAMGKYAPILQNAAAQGGSQLANTHFVLMSSDPEYQKQFKEAEGSLSGGE